MNEQMATVWPQQNIMGVDDSKKIMLIKAGQALYGERWQTDLARDLKLSDVRRVRQWLSGDRSIPNGVWNDIAKLLADRKVVIDELLISLNDMRNE